MVTRRSTGIDFEHGGGSWRHHIKVTPVRRALQPSSDLRYTDYGFRLACAAE